jgi:hypothetical protein
MRQRIHVYSSSVLFTKLAGEGAVKRRRELQSTEAGRSVGDKSRMKLGKSWMRSLSAGCDGKRAILDMDPSWGRSDSA